MNSIYELVRNAVNKHGELHLDKERTELLLHWLSACETNMEKMDGAFRDLCTALEPLGINIKKDPKKS